MNVLTRSFERQEWAGALPRRCCTWGSSFAQMVPEAVQILQNSDPEPNRQRATSNPSSHGTTAAPGGPAHAGGSCLHQDQCSLLAVAGAKAGGSGGCRRKGVVMVTNDLYSPKEAQFQFNRGKTQGRRKG